MESTAVETLSVSTGTPNDGSMLICVGLDKFIVEETLEGSKSTAAGEMGSMISLAMSVTTDGLDE